MAGGGVRAAAVLPALALLLLPCAPATPSPASAAARQVSAVSAPGPGAAVVEVRGVSPAAPVEGDVLSVSGTVANRSEQEIRGARVALRVAGGSVGTRSELGAVAAKGAVTAADGTRAEPTDPVGRLRPGQRAGFRLRVPVDDLGLTAPGPYPLTLVLTGPDGTVYGQTRTFLPWYPSAVRAEPLRTAVLWPLTDVPHMQALTLGSGDAAEPAFRDDALADSFAPGGRLRRLVEAGKGRPVSWLIDPDLIVEAQAMVDGYRVADTPDTTDPRKSTRGRGGGAAADWLDALRAAVRGREVAALPYADPDVASLAHHGRSDLARQAGQVERTRDGEAVLEGALGVRARRDLVWPVAGALDESITALVRRMDRRVLLASGVGLTGEPGERGPTDERPVALAGGLTALPYDTVLTGVLGGVSGPQVVAARQRLLAETLTAVGEAPNAPRGLVVAPPREMSGAAARALALALSDGTEAGWLKPVRLATALRGPVPGRAGTEAGYPAALRRTELPAARLAEVARDGRQLRSLARVLADPEHTTRSVRAALARAVSTGWRGHPVGNRSYVDGLTGFLTASRASVRLLPKSTVTVAGDSAKIPVTVENALQQPVSGIEVRVTSSRPERVEVVDGAVPARVSRAASRTVRVEVRAHANGPVRLTAQLYTSADGKPWGRPIAFTAEVRSVSSGAITIVAGGLLLILLAVVFQLGRARRRRAR
ncbi:hypothetical protein ACZ90_06590 [Streptomyces albus subsp. albus]|nr:hypothetical protein ACZ90_06590 [Streptomyces albus subsp. albus]